MHRSLTILLKGDSTAELRILTNNVRGLGDQNKRRELFYWLKLHNISIACLQETFITKDKLCKISQEWEGFSFNSISDSNHSKGVSILIKKDLDIRIINTLAANDGRKVLINFMSHDTTYTVCAIYAPVNYTEKNTFYYSLSSWIEQNREPHSKLIVCRDFNVSNFSARIIRKKSPEKVLHDFLKKFKLSDVYLEKCEATQPGFHVLQSWKKQCQKQNRLHSGRYGIT